MTPGSGTIVDHEYELLELLGKGGMGEVWRAKSFSGFVAIKFVLPELQQHASILKRFKSEILMVARLRSAHVVHSTDFGVDPALGPYLVMELLKGQSLREVLHSSGRFQNAAVAVDFLLQACDAVGEAHSLNIVHRDLKPENVFLAEGADRVRSVKVLDFGIARANDDLRNLTHPGGFVGTRNYSSPEQWANSSRVTKRSDIWSLGTILYEMLAGVPAFPDQDERPDALLEPRSLAELRPGLPKALIECVERCLVRDPAGRYQEVQELVQALLPFRDDRASAEAAPTVNADGFQNAPSPEPREATGQPLPERDKLIEAILKSRRADGSPRRVVFMLGAGFSLPVVPGTAEIVDLIAKELSPSGRAQLDAIKSTSGNLYQDAFNLLPDPFKQNEVIRSAVLRRGFKKPAKLAKSENEQNQQCIEWESQHEHWRLPEGVEHLGAIIQAGLLKHGPDGFKAGPGDPRFSAIHLTTNFDPLLEIAIRKRGGVANPTAIDTDGGIPGLDRQTCHIVHLHGRWERGDTLHNDLNTPRPVLEAHLGRLLRGNALVVVGYGGWDDVFMKTLKSAAHGSEDFQVFWAFFQNEQEAIESQHGKLISDLKQALRNRVRFFRGVDTNSFFRDLLTQVVPSEQPIPQPKPPETDIPKGRVLDAAIPSHVLKGRAVGLDVLVRLPESPGLKGILQQDQEAEAKPDDVVSKGFNLLFPRGSDGTLQSLKATVVLESPDFSPSRQQKNFHIPPNQDSEVVNFLVTPLRTGQLPILVELHWEEAVRGARRLRTQCVAETTEALEAGQQNVVSLPLGPQRSSASRSGRPLVPGPIDDTLELSASRDGAGASFPSPPPLSVPTVPLHEPWRKAVGSLAAVGIAAAGIALARNQGVTAGAGGTATDGGSTGGTLSGAGGTPQLLPKDPEWKVQVSCKLAPKPEGQLTLDGGTFSLATLCELDGKPAPTELVALSPEGRIETTDPYYTLAAKRSVAGNATEPSALSFEFGRRDSVVVPVNLLGKCADALSFRVNEKAVGWSASHPLRAPCKDFSLLLPSSDFGKKFRVRVQKGSCDCVTDAVWNDRTLKVELCQPPVRCGVAVPPLDACQACRNKCESDYAAFTRSCQTDDCVAPWNERRIVCVNKCGCP